MPERLLGNWWANPGVPSSRHQATASRRAHGPPHHPMQLRIPHRTVHRPNQNRSAALRIAEASHLLSSERARYIGAGHQGRFEKDGPKRSIAKPDLHSHRSPMFWSSLEQPIRPAKITDYFAMIHASAGISVLQSSRVEPPVAFSAFDCCRQAIGTIKHLVPKPSSTFSTLKRPQNRQILWAIGVHACIALLPILARLPIPKAPGEAQEDTALNTIPARASTKTHIRLSSAIMPHLMKLQRNSATSNQAVSPHYRPLPAWFQPTQQHARARSQRFGTLEGAIHRRCTIRADLRLPWPSFTPSSHHTTFSWSISPSHS